MDRSSHPTPKSERHHVDLRLNHAADCTDPDGAFHRLHALTRAGVTEGLLEVLADEHWVLTVDHEGVGEDVSVLRAEFQSRTLPEPGRTPSKGAHWHKRLDSRGDSIVVFTSSCCAAEGFLMSPGTFGLLAFIEGRADAAPTFVAI